MSQPRLTREQAAIIGLYTGVLCGPFADLQRLAEELMGRPVWTHEFSLLQEKLTELARPQFLALCAEEEK